MTKDEFIKLWEDSIKEQILNQYYYDYEEMVKSHNIIKEVKDYIENPIHDMPVKTYQELLDILEMEVV